MRFLIQHVHNCAVPPWFMGRAYYNYRCNRLVYVLYPFHWLAALAWWIQHRWARHTDSPSWIDRQVEAGIEQRRSSH